MGMTQATILKIFTQTMRRNSGAEMPVLNVVRFAPFWRGEKCLKALGQSRIVPRNQRSPNDGSVRAACSPLLAAWPTLLTCRQWTTRISQAGRYRTHAHCPAGVKGHRLPQAGSEVAA
jgi:hypothetical protein